MRIPEIYKLSPTQVRTLKILHKQLIECSPAEIAVYGLLLPNEVTKSLESLRQLGLVNERGEHLYVLNNLGRKLFNSLTNYLGCPPVGTMIPVRTPFWKQSPISYIEIVAE